MSDSAAQARGASFPERLRRVWLFLSGCVILTGGALLMLLAALLTLFQARRFYAEVIGRAMGRIALRLSGIRLVMQGRFPEAASQVVYISNHTSTLDVLVVLALGLPNTRFFMSGFLRKIPPVALVGYLMGIFWTVPQQYPARRRRIFQRAERVLRRTGESVYLSPEGMRIRTGQIAHFNKGAFHLATKLGAPLQPFYIEIPAAIDPGMGLIAQPGTVTVHVLPQIATQTWRLDDLEQNRDRVREVFVDCHERLRVRLDTTR